MKYLLAVSALLMFVVPGHAQRARASQASLTRAEVKAAEQMLSDLGYWTGPIDGIFDAGSHSALLAFQKWQGREATGELSSNEFEAIRTAARPRAREVGYRHVEVDLDRQVLMLVDEAGGVRILPVSTGNNKTFIDEGQESIAYTPRGRFLVYGKEVGWKTGSLGSTYYANFISGGVAIHGSRSVPNEPASHGCIRIPMFAARDVSRLLKLGTIVLVYDKLSFVSAMDWAKNPKLKEAAMASLGAEVDDGFDPLAANSKAPTAKKPRPRSIRS
jgi:peptidoglycan hydrolase-like protein with peptidoglycan-binding domain